MGRGAERDVRLTRFVQDGIDIILPQGLGVEARTRGYLPLLNNTVTADDNPVQTPIHDNRINQTGPVQSGVRQRSTV